MRSFEKPRKLTRVKILNRLCDYEAAFRATRLAMMKLLSEQAHHNKRYKRPQSESETQVTPNSRGEAYQLAPKRAKFQSKAIVTPERPRAQDEAKVAPETPKVPGKEKMASNRLKGKHEARDHPCMHCGEIFPTGQALGGHQRRHYLEKLKMKMPGVNLKSDTNFKTKKMDPDLKGKKLEIYSKAKKWDIDLNRPTSFWDMEDPMYMDIGETSSIQKYKEETRETSSRSKDEEEKGERSLKPKKEEEKVETSLKHKNDEEKGEK